MTLAERLKDEREYEEWLERIEAAGSKLTEVKCDECGGVGEVTCSHCGNGEVECEVCDGTGKTVFPSLDDFLRIRRDERKLSELWNAGVPYFGKNYTLSDDTRQFLFELPESHPDNVNIVALAIP